MAPSKISLIRPASRLGQLVALLRASSVEPWFALLWLPGRVWLGWQWLEDGWMRLERPAWSDGVQPPSWPAAVEGAAQPAVPIGWFSPFLQPFADSDTSAWIANAVAYGETLVGVALVLGLLTGVAAFVGGLLAMHFVLAGAVASAPATSATFVLAACLMLAWRNAGWIGFDHWLLPLLGVARRTGPLFQSLKPASAGRAYLQHHLEEVSR